ncbi:hypothetical protein CYY_000973 [Polysphondylium violaceum]|uniref:DUF4397 domain-containing protein n=1 Tax=Polysphondylium violaceum TaxID=133409 RepID=A0A8J4Q9Z0_9MYCE|nr:hypothetical protein CYY_000973 [Polysphondylium violaceum]
MTSYIKSSTHHQILKSNSYINSPYRSSVLIALFSILIILIDQGYSYNIIISNSNNNNNNHNNNENNNNINNNHINDNGNINIKQNDNSMLSFFNYYYNNNNNNDKKNNINVQNNNNQNIIPILSHIRIINTILESNDDIDISFNNSIYFKRLSYLSVSEYMKIPIGLMNIDLINSNTGNQMQSKSKHQIDGGNFYTLLISGNATKANDKYDGPSLTILRDDNNFPIHSRRTLLRFIHCSPTSDSIDLSIENGGTLFSEISYIGSNNNNQDEFINTIPPSTSTLFTPLSTTNFISIPNSNPYSIFVHQPGNTSEKYTIPDSSLLPTYPSLHVTTLMLVGMKDSAKYPLLLFSVSNPNPSLESTKNMMFFHQKQITGGNINQQKQQPNQRLSTSESSTNIVKFSLAILSFIFLAFISVA